MAAVRKKDIWICSAWQDKKKVTVHTCVSSDEKRGCRISKYFCWAAALLSAPNGIEISYGSDAIL